MTNNPNSPHEDKITYLAKRSRDIQSIVWWIVLIAGLGWVITDNTRVRKWVAEISGVPMVLDEISHLRTDINDRLSSTNAQIDELTTLVNEGNAQRRVIISRVELLEKSIRTDHDSSPSIEFLPSGNYISDGHIGQLVRISWNFKKLRNCGKSMPDDILIDSNGVLAHFVNVSIVDSEGKGLASPVMTEVQNLTYTARIPEGVGLSPGRAEGFVTILYDKDNCPAVPPMTSPRVSFNILPGAAKDPNIPIKNGNTQ